MPKINPYYYIALFLVLAGQGAAFAQNSYDPNLGHFYMGRQQITIEDNSPIIRDKTGATVNGANGALLNRPAPLPKAGWQGYAPIDNTNTNPNLPKVPGPVRQAAASRNQAGNGQKGEQEI